MNLHYRPRDPKTRRLLAIANFSLVLGLLPWIFREYIHVSHNWLDASRGFFIGLSITVNLWALRRARRCSAG
ncbi:MAG: hypothetical protein ABSG32_30675 [Terriglobia bacterium]|jgi:hypothetical protein